MTYGPILHQTFINFIYIMMQPNIYVNDPQNMCQSKHTKMTSVVSVNTISSWKQEPNTIKLYLSPRRGGGLFLFETF